MKGWKAERLWLALTGICLLGAAVEGARLQGALGVCDDLALLFEGQDLPFDRHFHADERVLLARAVFLAGRERRDDALALYSRLAATGGALRQAALYDLGNLQIRQALDKAEQGQFTQAMPYAELAKEAYRGALTLDAGDWDAKYNLEFAMRLLPEMARRNSGSDETPPEEAARRNWTTLPGFPRGLP